MIKNSDGAGADLIGVAHETAGPKADRIAKLRVKIAGGVLALLNGIALFFYLSPPGGTREELTQQSAILRNQIAVARTRTARVQQTAAKVQNGSSESNDFEAQYFLPKRLAYVSVIEEIQRMSKASGLQEKDAAYTLEPIEGTADLSLMNITSSYEGSYSSLMKFLYEADHSPMLLMLDQLAASPQQKNGQISTAIRFQAIVREPPPPAGGLPQ